MTVMCHILQIFKPDKPEGNLGMDNDSYRSNEEFDYGYAQCVSDDESEEENDGERDINEDGEGGWEDIDKLGFRDL